MSLDTITRVNSFFKSVIATPKNLYTIYLDKNEDIEDDSGGGVFVKISTESSFDDLAGNSTSERCYTEIGIVIIEVFAPVGLGTKDLYSHERVVTLIRDAFRDIKLDATGNEEGGIYFQDINTSKSFNLPSRQGRDYQIKNIFINYQKTYST
jgi:hypothetical protein